MAISFDKAFGIHERALGIQSRRSAVLADNIANADTPGYKARDIDFRAALAQAQRAAPASRQLQQTDERHFQGSPRFIATETLFRVPIQPDTGDGNTVDAAVEQAAFAEASMQYQTSLTFMSSKIRSLLTAIRGD